MVTLADKLSISTDVLVSEVGKEAVLLNQATGKYFTLDEVGARIWQLIVTHRQLEQVHQVMLAEFDVDARRLELDLIALTDKLVANELLHIDAA